MERSCFECRTLRRLWRLARSGGGCMPVRPTLRTSRNCGFCLYHQVAGHWSTDCPMYLNWLHTIGNATPSRLPNNSNLSRMPNQNRQAPSNPEPNWEELLAPSSDESVHVITIQSDSEQSDSIPESYDDPDQSQAEEGDYYDSSEEEPVMIPPGKMMEEKVRSDDLLSLENMFRTDGEAVPSHSRDECHVSLRSGTQIPERQPPKEKEKGARMEETTGGGHKSKTTVGEYNILAHLRKVPALLSVFDALTMSQELREVMMQFLQNPKEYQTNSAITKPEEVMYNDSAVTITFDDEDMLVGTYRHNKPLYIAGSSNGVKLNRMLVDPGSSINILPIKSLRYLTPTKNLSTEEITIHGFDQHAQKSLGAVTLPFQFGELNTQIKFYVIEADTSYRALLGRPWLHENHLVPSTLHQCIKYIENGKQKKIKGEVHPFAVREVGILGSEQIGEGTKTIRFRIKIKGTVAEKEDSAQITKQIPKNGKTSLEAIQKQSHSPNTRCEIGECSSKNHSSHNEAKKSAGYVLKSELYPKGLTPREVNRVEALDVMFVPAKVEYTGEKKVIHPPILFYKVGEICPGNGQEETMQWKKWLKKENEDKAMVPVKLQGHYKPEIMPLFHKMRCLEPISQERVKIFETLWNKTPRKVTGVDGKIKYTRGLGYHKTRDKISIRKDYEKFWGVDSDTYLKVKIDQTPEPIYTCHTIEAEINEEGEQFFLTAQQSLELYQARMTRAYDKLIRPRTFQKGELVLVLRRPITGRHHGPKFSPNWEGPYVINQAYDGGAYLLADKEGNHPMPPINGRYLKKYYA